MMLAVTIAREASRTSPVSARARLSFVAGVVLSVGLAAPASAGTCSDYSNQADAQRAADTRDPDGDGIYCESLPCPCLARG